MTTPRKRVSLVRKALYYSGIAVTTTGMLSFLCAFITFSLRTTSILFANFGNFTQFDSSRPTETFREFCAGGAIGGMLLAIIGGFLVSVGARGWVNSAAQHRGLPFRNE